jgi:hypothetical protein
MGGGGIHKNTEKIPGMRFFDFYTICHVSSQGRSAAAAGGGELESVESHGREYGGFGSGREAESLGCRLNFFWVAGEIPEHAKTSNRYEVCHLPSPTKQ